MIHFYQQKSDFFHFHLNFSIFWRQYQPCSLQTMKLMNWMNYVQLSFNISVDDESFSLKMTLVFDLLVYFVNWSRVSEHWYVFCQISILSVLQFKSSPVYYHWSQIQKMLLKKLHTWMAILQNQIIAVLPNAFYQNWENVVKTSEHWCVDSRLPTLSIFLQ